MVQPKNCSVIQLKNRLASRFESCLWSRFLLGMIAECKNLGNREFSFATRVQFVSGCAVLDDGIELCLRIRKTII